jgi:hypothetical protein
MEKRHDLIPDRGIVDLADAFGGKVSTHGTGGA